MTTVPSLQKTRKGQKNSSTRYRASSETPDLARKQHTSRSPLLESGEGAGGSYSLMMATPSPTARHRKARLETIYNSHLNPRSPSPPAPRRSPEWRGNGGLMPDWRIPPFILFQLLLWKGREEEDGVRGRLYQVLLLKYGRVYSAPLFKFLCG